MWPLSARGARISAAVWLALTTGLLLAPGSAAGTGSPLPELIQEGFELAVHFVLFFVLAWLVRRASSGSRWGGLRAAAAPPVYALTGYCAALEFLQILIPHRGFEWLDIVFGCLGILLGWRQGRVSPDR